MFTVALTLLLFICIVRYLERPERRWLITGAASIALMLANHEVIFAILALFGGYLYAVLAVDRIITWWRDDRRAAAQLVLAAHAVAVIGLGAVLLFTSQSAKDEILDIPWRTPTRQQQIDYYQKLATNPGHHSAGDGDRGRAGDLHHRIAPGAAIRPTGS